MSVRVLHAADLHLDSPFQGLSDALAARRRQEQRSLLARLAETAVTEKADLVLLAGDLLDSDRAFPETLRALEETLGKLPVPVFIAPGNHDYYDRRGPYARLRLPENVHVFRSPTLQCVELPELDVRVWGAAFTEPRAENLLAGFHAPRRETGLELLLLHADAENPASPYCPVTGSDLAQSGADYAALGHIHRFSGLKKAGGTFYAWPGCAQGRGFDETGEKGVILAELDRGSCALRFLPLPGRRYERLTVDLSAGTDALSAVRSALPADTEPHSYRITLTGETAFAPDLAGLHDALAERFFSLQLRDETRPLRDLWEGQGEDSLRGLFLTELRQQYDRAETEEERRRIARAVRWGLAAMDGGEAPQ